MRGIIILDRKIIKNFHEIVEILVILNNDSFMILSVLETDVFRKIQT